MLCAEVLLIRPKMNECSYDAYWENWALIRKKTNNFYKWANALNKALDKCTSTKQTSEEQSSEQADPKLDRAKAGTSSSGTLDIVDPFLSELSKIIPDVKQSVTRYSNELMEKVLEYARGTEITSYLGHIFITGLNFHIHVTADHVGGRLSPDDNMWVVAPWNVDSMDVCGMSSHALLLIPITPTTSSTGLVGAPAPAAKAPAVASSLPSLKAVSRLPPLASFSKTPQGVGPSTWPKPKFCPAMSSSTLDRANLEALLSDAPGSSTMAVIDIDNDEDEIQFIEKDDDNSVVCVDTRGRHTITSVSAIKFILQPMDANLLDEYLDDVRGIITNLCIDHYETDFQWVQDLRCHLPQGNRSCCNVDNMMDHVLAEMEHNPYMKKSIFSVFRWWGCRPFIPFWPWVVLGFMHMERQLRSSAPTVVTTWITPAPWTPTSACITGQPGV